MKACWMWASLLARLTQTLLPLAENETADPLKVSNAKVVQSRKVAADEEGEACKTSKGNSGDPYKFESPGEDLDVLGAMIPGFDFAVSAPSKRGGISNMGNEEEDLLKYLLSSSQ